MLTLAATAAVAATPPARFSPSPTTVAIAHVTVRVLRSGRTGEREWTDAVHKREILVREEDGRTTRLRLIEHE